MTDTATRDLKRAAVEQWTAEPCGAAGVPGEPGTLPCLERLLESRAAYASWMATALDYSGAVDGFRPDDLRPTRALTRTALGPLLLQPRLVAWLGRVSGWYVVGCARAPE